MCCTVCLQVSSLRSSVAGLLTQKPAQMTLQKAFLDPYFPPPPPISPHSTSYPSHSYPPHPIPQHPLIEPGLSPNYRAILCFPEDPSQYKVILLMCLLTVFHILFLHSTLLKFRVLNNNHFIMLMNSVSQEFGENAVGVACLQVLTCAGPKPGSLTGCR